MMTRPHENNELVPGTRLDQRTKLLNAYASFKSNRRYSYDWEPAGLLTDELAAGLAGLGHTGYWKRCSELRRDGFIQVVKNKNGAVLTRKAKSGVQVMLCKVTLEGVKELRKNLQDAQASRTAKMTLVQKQVARRAAIRNGL